MIGGRGAARGWGALMVSASRARAGAAAAAPPGKAKSTRCTPSLIRFRLDGQFVWAEVSSTRSALTRHSRACASVSYDALLEVLGLRLAKYRPVTPATSGDEAR